MMPADTGGAFYRFFFGTSYNRTTYNGVDLQDLYRRNELAFACISKIADVMNDAELIVEKKTAKGDWERVEGHLLSALLRKPNTEEIGLDFRKKMVQSENFAGLCYIRLIRPRPEAPPTQLYILNPNRVYPQIDYSRGILQYYRYSNILGYQEQIAPEDILIRRRADLTDEFGGLAPLLVAANTIDADENMTDYINAFFDPTDGNAGIPAGILKFQSTLSPELAEMKRKMWNKNTSAKEVQVLDQNAEFIAVASKVNELGSDTLRAQNEAKVLQVFGVPAILVSAYVGYLHTTQNATAKSALKDFWLNKISPELKTLREWATWFLLPLFEDINAIKREQIRVNWDLSGMLALQEDIDKVHDDARKNFLADGWTKNEFRIATGKDPRPDGDKFRSEYIQPKQITAPADNPAPPKGNQLRLQLKAAPAHEFSSTQLDVPTAEKKILLEFGKSFILDEDLAEDGREDKPHITVKYGLHTDNADDVKELLADVAPFEVTLGKTSIFPGKGDIDYDVVKIDVKSPELHAINKLISDNLDVTDTHPKYIPHLTIAYVIKGKGENYVGDATFDGQKILFDKITFSDKNRNKTTIKLTGTKSQKKTFEFDGLTLSREPNAVESLIDLKSLVADLDTQSQNLETALLKYRANLIEQAIAAADKLDERTIFTLTLERNEKLAKFIEKSLRASFEKGRAQIVREINAQKAESNFERKDLTEDELKAKLTTLSDSVLAKLINEIQSRAVNIFVALKLAGNFTLELLKEKLSGESTAFVSQTARNASNLAIQSGRTDEIGNQAENWQRVQYSAILDRNTCDYCDAADGMESTDEADLPEVPNPECLGGSNCRCFIVVILD